MWIAITIIALYLVFGVLTSWCVMCAVAPDAGDNEERQEAVAVLGMLALVLWPLFAAMFLCGAVLCREDGIEDDEENDEEV